MDDVLFLSRLQFALTISFHYIYPPLSIGLGVVLVVIEGLWLKTGNVIYHQMARFWTRIFALTFAIGVATGIVMEFEFGTNWATYSRFVGDVFGSALAAEGIFAFFLESGFLAVLLFGWDKVGRKMHYFSTWMVCLGAHFSAVWIVVANSWQQTPAGYHIVGEGIKARAEITDFWAMVFNPSSVDRLSHTLCGCWQAGAWLVVSVSAWYLWRRRHVQFAQRSIRVGLAVALVASLLQLVTGHSSAEGVARNQPAKLAAFEGHYATEPGKLWLFGWVDQEKEEVKFGLGIPKMLSWLVHGDGNKPVTGLRDIPKADRPSRVNFVFQTYHLMVGIGMALIGLAVLSNWLIWRKQFFSKRWLMLVLVFSVLGPQFANQFGWWSAEVGRQPWIVYGLLRTSEGISKVLTAEAVIASLIMFTVIYVLLFAVFIYLLNEKIQHGPDEKDLTPTGKLAIAAPVLDVIAEEADESRTEPESQT
ncbi:cytochrome ubiquinol oxidase subunit I [Verrucomicrobium sp. BvORR034]|uniref:cytochrome ubiquinol oxidase subunit I n=1 Tax=Verrucomicrobium sp. BvORR034 TaxID=1396418 RepID=UPI0006794F02|nr:cytochrome ubiquinol oxidase subunit I [Verrucomicrobium sp. BvORR034]